MSTLKFNQWLNTDNTENYKCRAWVNFNGTGTVAIRASGNVSSITDNGTGNYQVNFTTAMPDANYVAVSGTGDSLGQDMVTSRPNTTSSCIVRGFWSGAVNAPYERDITNCGVAIFR